METTTETITKSLWLATSPAAPSFPALASDITVDVCVVGAGITGVTAALLLARAGKSVALLDARRVGGVDTESTTAHLTAVLDTRYHRLVRDFGEDGARLVAWSQRQALDRIAGLVTEEKIDCDFQRVPAFLYAERPEQTGELEQEINAARLVGLMVEKASDLPFSFPVLAAARFPDQARFHPVRYVRALANCLRRLPRVHIYEQTRAVEFVDGEPCQVVTKQGVVTARDVLVTTYTPVSDRFFLHTKIAAYRTYALALRHPNPPDGLFWDMDDPYHYIRRQSDSAGDLLVVGGEDHKTGTTEDTNQPFERLREYAFTRFGTKDVAYRWSGQILETVDGLPFIGKDAASSHTYVATGYSGNGMTHGTAAAALLADLVQGRENPYADLYQATRIKPLAAARDFVSENLDIPAHLIGDRFRSAEGKDVADVAPGEGKILSLNGAKCAVYRASSGSLTVLSPVCPHLACHVHWNTAEKTWDCPCHGSRFEATGAVINGPALQPLARKTL